MVCVQIIRKSCTKTQNYYKNNKTRQSMTINDAIITTLFYFDKKHPIKR